MARRTAQSNNATISNMTRTITQGSAEPVIQIDKIGVWEMLNIKMLDEDVEDALSTFTNRKGNCLGHANLSSAIGRAIGLPTRSLSGIIKDNLSMQTHYINEYYLGPSLGWRQFDSTVAVSNVNEDGYIIFHNDTPSNQNDF